jgi:hypothetical protein
MLVVAGVPPEAPPAFVLPVGVVSVLVAGGGVGPVGVVVAPEVVGAPATDTVLVEPPHPPNRVIAAAASIGIQARAEIGRGMRAHRIQPSAQGAPLDKFISDR